MKNSKKILSGFFGLLVGVLAGVLFSLLLIFIPSFISWEIPDFSYFELSLRVSCLSFGIGGYLIGFIFNIFEEENKNEK